MIGGFLPLLRSPPFPWVDPAVAAVSAPAVAPEPGPVPMRDSAALFAAIRAARVGGTFWALPAGSGAGEVDPWSLLANAPPDAVDADDELAALALIAGQPVRLRGRGRFGDAARGVDPALVAGAILGCDYRDPFTGAATSVEATVALLGEWRRLIDLNRPVAVAAGITRWKRETVARFFWAPRRTPLAFVTAPRAAVARAAAAGGSIAAWPSRVSPELHTLAAGQAVPVAAVEDGFVRSVGLGSALHLPRSVTFDRLGIHYDPSGPSELEALLAGAQFDAGLLARARALRERIVAGRVSKYGAAGPAEAALPERLAGRRTVLVPGQVGDDLSVLRGGTEFRDAAELLSRVRALEPAAEIWFRPHPDVDAGFRNGRIPDADALRHADRIVRGGSMVDLLDRVDAVHVLTSLAGFEALLRGREVTTHGVPFYAGWGLTRDMVPPPARRGRRLTLDELVAATLILYPRYLDPATGLPCPVEVLVGRMAGQAAPRATWLTRLRGVQGQIMRQLRRARR